MSAQVVDRRVTEVGRHADLQPRHAISVEFIAYESAHADGITSTDQDPDTHVAEHQ